MFSLSLHRCSPQKLPLQPFSYNVVGARTLYIGKTPKTLLFAVCSRFPV